MSVGDSKAARQGDVRVHVRGRRGTGRAAVDKRREAVKER